MNPLTFEIAVIGNFCIDQIKLPTNPEPYVMLGGASAYVSVVARRLGASVTVLSKVGSDFPQEYFNQLLREYIDLSGVIKVENELSTSFELTYNQDLSARILRLKSKGSPIGVDDLPSNLRARAIHVAPVASELSYEIVERLRHCCDFLSIDPQGMTRCFGLDGSVDCSAQMDRRILSLVDIYKSSFDELSALTGKTYVDQAIADMHSFGPKTVIVTFGAQGAVLSDKNMCYRIPACEPKLVVDPTGAGDAFIGAFLSEYLTQNDPFWSACVGSAAASLVVETVGTRFSGDKLEIYKRARQCTEESFSEKQGRSTLIG